MPVGAAGREIRVHHDRQGADARDVVHDRGDGVDRDVGEAVLARLLEPVAREDRLRAEALNDERELLATELEHERARPARFLDHAPAVGGDQRRRGLSVPDRGALALVEDVVVDARLAVLAGHVG